MSVIVGIDRIQVLVEDNRFIENYFKGKNLPLNFNSIKIKVSELANGEYNYNFRIDLHIVYEEYAINEVSVFRLNYGSQMGIDNQIEYEFNALKLLAGSGVTPIPIFYDNSKNLIEQDYLVMSFIEGEHLSYRRDLFKAAEALIKIHTTEINSDFDFFRPDSPFEAMLDECKKMYSVYQSSNLYDEQVDKRVEIILRRAEYILNNKKENNDGKEVEKCFINTELNSSNFLVDGNFCSIVDWEKPIIAEKEQDVGHFLAPTTTFWKTDIVFDDDEVKEFLYYYYSLYSKYTLKESYNDADFEKFKEKVYDYIVFNCLRGVTWCAMAWVEYNNTEKTIVNEFTYNKLKEYLKYEFLDSIIDMYINK